MNDNLRKYFAEFFATFCMVFCGTGAIIVNQESGGTITHVGISMVFGLIVMSMIYAVGKISGAHMNPAVTLSFATLGLFNKKQILPFISMQFAGAMLASFLLHFLFPLNVFLGGTNPAGSEMQSFVLEFILSLMLMMVILHVSHGAKEEGIMAGIAIGSVVMLEAMFAGPICGASMNPFRSLAPAIVSGKLEHTWIYISAPVIAMVAAAGIFRLLHMEAKK